MLTERDKARLQGVHSDLVRLLMAADEAGAKFAVVEGVRTIERQRKLFAEGATKTMNSRHLTGHAVDIAPLVDADGNGTVEISWYWPHYNLLAKMIKAVAQEIGVRVEWGGDWVFKDGPHWQIPWSVSDAPMSAQAPRGPAVEATTAERGVLKVDGANPVTVALPKLARSWQTGEFWLMVGSVVAQALVLLSPLIDPAMDKLVANPAIAASPIAAAIFGAARLAYKAWRTQAAVSVAKTEVAR